MFRIYEPSLLQVECKCESKTAYNRAVLRKCGGRLSRQQHLSIWLWFSAERTLLNSLFVTSAFVRYLAAVPAKGTLLPPLRKASKSLCAIRSAKIYRANTDGYLQDNYRKQTIEWNYCTTTFAQQF